MKIATRRWLFNRYLVLSFCLVFFVSLLTWALGGGAIHSLLYYDGPYTLREYFSLAFGFASYADTGYTVFQLAAPVLPVLAILPLLQEMAVFPMAYPRVKSYPKMVLGRIFPYLLMSSFVLFAAFLCFLGVGLSLFELPQQAAYEKLFGEFLGGFYASNPAGGFLVSTLITGFLRFFVFSFFYGLFGVAVAFLTPKKYLCVLVPIAYFLIGSVFFAFLGNLFNGTVFTYISPSYILMPGSAPYVNGLVLFLPVLPVAVFSVAVMAWRFSAKPAKMDALGV